jgi:agmatinase
LNSYAGETMQAPGGARPWQFLEMPGDLASHQRARYAILPVPYEQTVSYGKGTAQGPGAIIEASEQVETFDEELLGEFFHAGIATYPPVEAASEPQEQMRRIREAARDIIQSGKFLIALGGEHSITAPLVEAVMETHGRLSVLQIDAHADLRDSYQGTPHSHAAVMRRVLEMTPDICQVGIRNLSREEFEACPEQVRRFITPRQIADDPAMTWIDSAVAMLRGPVYITIDIDGFDPAFAPGTGTPEPGGLSWREVTMLLRRVCEQRRVVGADIVEVAPIEGQNTTQFLAARLAYKLIAYTQLGAGSA